MPFIRMLPIDATIYFKQINKFKVESKSIAIVPRQGFDQASKMLADTNSFNALVQGTELIGNVAAIIVNIIPVADTSDLILGKLWIDEKQKLILIKPTLKFPKDYGLNVIIADCLCIIKH